MPEKKYKYGLVLSGGAARGFAHLGAMKALEEKNIFPEILAGTSAGSIAGAFYADGFHPVEILEIFAKHKLLDFLDFNLPKKGFLKATPIEKILKQNLRAKKFEDLKKPLFICVTDLNNGCPLYISEGDLISTIIASCAVPVVFEAVVKNNISYVDGGVLNNLPIEAINNKCEKIIALNVNPIRYQKKISGVIGVLVRSFLLAASKEIANKKHMADYYIEMEKIDKYHYHEINKGKEMFEIGYEAVKNYPF